MKSILVGQGKSKYPIMFTTSTGIVTSTYALAKTSQAVIIIADATAHALYPTLMAKLTKKLGKKATLLTIPSGERHKSGKQLLSLLESIISLGVDRSTTIVAFGGGVTTDIAGCVASLLLRGVKWIAIPTTFLGTIDAAIGGKTAVNSNHGKNLIGTFWPPQAVIIAEDFVRTQPKTEFAGSLGEALKYYALTGKPLVADIEELQRTFPEHDARLARKIIQTCARYKAQLVSSDERESGARAFLNFGHTIGHALEFCGGYGKIAHGRAVAAGMVGAIYLSAQAGMPMTGRVSGFEEHCRALAKGPKVKIGVEDALDSLIYDKKRRSGKLMFVLLKDIGKPYLTQAPNKRALRKAVELSIQALVK